MEKEVKIDGKKKGEAKRGTKLLAATAAVLITVFAIFLFTMAQGLALNLIAVAKRAESQCSLTVFFEEGLEEARIKEIGEELKARPEVEALRFVSAEEAWERMKELYFAENPELAEGFADDNPLADSASYEVYVKDAAEQTALAEFAKGLAGVRRVNGSEAVAGGLESLSRMAKGFGVGLMAAVLLAAVLLIGMGGRVAAVGMEAPAAWKGAGLGLVGTLLGLAVFALAYDPIGEALVGGLQTYSVLFTWLTLGEVISFIAPVALCLGVAAFLAGTFLKGKKCPYEGEEVCG